MRNQGSADRDRRGHADRRRLGRPRRVWGGLALTLVGMVVLGTGIAMLSWAIAVVGALGLVLGVVIGVLNGVLNDARSDLGAEEQVREVVHGTIHPGVVPGDMVTGSRARRDALRTSRAVRAARDREMPAPSAFARPCGAFLLLVALGGLTLVGALATHTPTGRSVAVRDMGLAVIIALAGLQLLMVPGRHAVTAGVALVTGLALALQGLGGAHDTPTIAPIEISLGTLVVVAAVTAWLSPDPGDDPASARAQGASESSVTSADVGTSSDVGVLHNVNAGRVLPRIRRLLTVIAVVALAVLRAVRGRKRVRADDVQGTRSALTE